MNNIPCMGNRDRVALLIILLVAFARGPDHRRGDEIGALRSLVLRTAN